MTLNLGYAVATLIFLAFFCVTVAIQVASRRYHPAVYWAVVVATTTVGTTMSDFLDRSVGLGYITSSVLLFAGVIAILFLWRRVTGRIVFENITSKKDEVFYWVTILVSNTLGTALGDYVATDTGLGFERGALVFSGLLALMMAAHFWLKRVPPSVLFWSAYVLTRPLGATLGDTFTKPRAEGGIELGSITTSLIIAILMIIGVALMTWRERHRADLPDKPVETPGA